MPHALTSTRRLSRKFIAAGAVRHSGAIAFEPRGWSQKCAFARLRDGDAIKPGARGHWYLDRTAYSEWRADHRKRLYWLSGIVVIFGGMAVAAIR